MYDCVKRSITRYHPIVIDLSKEFDVKKSIKFTNVTFNKSRVRSVEKFSIHVIFSTI